MSIELPMAMFPVDRMISGLPPVAVIESPGRNVTLLEKSNTVPSEPIVPCRTVPPMFTVPAVVLKMTEDEGVNMPVAPVPVIGNAHTSTPGEAARTLAKKAEKNR